MRGPRGLLASFGYAAKGLRYAFMHERNLRIHCCAAFYVYLLAAACRLSPARLAVLTLFIALVISTELLNTTVEYLVDLWIRKMSATAGVVKDVAAGAVLVVSVAAVAGGIFLFKDDFSLSRIVDMLAKNPLVAVLLLLSLGASAFVVFGVGRKKRGEL